MERRYGISAAVALATILVSRVDAPTTPRLIPADERNPVVRKSQVMGIRQGSNLSSHGNRTAKG